MDIGKNPILKVAESPTADLAAIDRTVVHRRQVDTKRRQIRDQRRTETAAEAIEGLDKDVELFGFTKGQFSIIDLLRAVLDITGPAALVISTWTAANADVSTVLDFVGEGKVTGARWLVDFTFQRRSPALAQRIRQVFGENAIRVAQNHAKFSLISNNDWRVVIRTSMNLNFNPRFEDYTIAHDPELFDFMAGIIDEIWTKQDPRMANERPQAIKDHFRDKI